MKRLLVLCMTALLGLPLSAQAHDGTMKTWVHAPSGFSADYPDMFWLSTCEEEAVNSASLNLRSADGKLELDLVLSPLEKNATVEKELASCMEDGLVVPGSARYGEDWFKLTLLQGTTLRSIFVRMEDEKMAGYTFARPLGDTTITNDLLYRMQKSVHFGSKDAPSDLLPVDILSVMGWAEHYGLCNDGEHFCKAGTTEALGEALPVSGFNFDRWRWFVVSEETPEATGSDYGLWLLRPGSEGNKPAFIPLKEETEIAGVSINADGSRLLISSFYEGTHHMAVYDFRTLARLHTFESDSMAEWIDSSRYLYTEAAPVTRYLGVQTSGVNSVVMADNEGNRTILRAATMLDNYQLGQVSVEEQKYTILHNHAHSVEDWGTWENVSEEKLILPFPD